ncbi:hypothetical protein PMIN01_07043 [Paraphaeosphaeria minitans]|uniref:Uncharacterized protein n=1 Tax=Paraphaeosphaeria minitans TaxID=565426 RepID=A0A9P6KQC6_9PLEO|nr:hypothetical protein PMIN01_07043 [Paraphaeosphaeria minitans]
MLWTAFARIFMSPRHVLQAFLKVSEASAGRNALMHVRLHYSHDPGWSDFRFSIFPCETRMNQDFDGTLSGKLVAVSCSERGKKRRLGPMPGVARHSWMTTSHKEQCGVQIIVLRHNGSYYTAGLSRMCDG